MASKHSGVIHQTEDRNKQYYSDGFLPVWISDKEKESNQLYEARKALDFYDMALPIDQEMVSKINVNWGLHAGYWDDLEHYSQELSFDLGADSIDIGFGDLKHFPVLDRVSKAALSDFISKPLRFNVKDNSSKARNFRERVQLDRVKNYFQGTIIQPERQRITMEYDVEMGIRDPYSLSIEQQQQREADIQNRFKQQVPEEIFKYMQRLRTPDELVAQSVLKEALRHSQGRHQFNLGAEEAIVTGGAYYRVGIRHGKPFIKALNRKYLRWSGSENVEFCENGTAAVYDEYLSIQDALTKFSSIMVKKDVKAIDDMFTEVPGHRRETDDRHNKPQNKRIDRGVMDYLADHPEVNNNLNIKSREGQEKLKALYARFGNYSRNGRGIRHTFVTWKWFRRVKFVKRLVGNKPEIFIRGHHYRKDPLAGDLQVVERIIPQVWEGEKLGDEFYMNVRARPNQYKDPKNPYDPELSIYGGEYNTFRKNARSVSLIDLGKPWQYKFNVQMDRMEKNQAMNIGKVFLGTTTMKPKSWTWSQWFKAMFIGKTALISNHREGINNLDPSIFRSIDLSRDIDVARDVELLQFYENKIVTSMYYTPQKMGQISQYATNQNTELAVQGVDRQMFRFHERDRLIRNKVLNGLLHTALYAYKDDEEVKSTIFDDFLRAHYELNFNSIESSVFTLEVEDAFADTQKLKEIRGLALTLLQNGMTPRQLSTIMSAETTAELNHYLEDIDLEIQKKVQEEREHEVKVLQEQRQAAIEQRQMVEQYNTERHNKELKMKDIMSMRDSMKFYNAADVDRNKEPDSVQAAKVKEEAATERLEKELEHKEKENEKDRRVEAKKDKNKS